MSAATETIHASCVAWEDRGLLILGRPGAGKSRLALELIGLGATLVADDRVALRISGEALRAAAPPGVAGLIEARGVGILRVPHRAEAAAALAVDLDLGPPERLPAPRAARLLGLRVPLLCGREGPGAAALLSALRWWPPLDPDAAVEAVDDARDRPDA